MRRRDFLSVSAAIGSGLLPRAVLGAMQDACEDDCLQTYATPEAAQASAPEKLAFVVATYVGTSVNQPDYLAVVDVDPESPTYSQVVHRVEMPFLGDELHHFGWNACSSCHGDPSKTRRYLIVPGLRSSRLHVIDVSNPREAKLHKVIEAKEIADKVNLSAPHTVHCLADGNIMLSMLGDRNGNSPGGFLLLNQDFEIVGRWEQEGSSPQFNYDFWYQPRHNVMVSSEWAAPRTFQPGFDLEDVEAGRYGRSLHFWNWEEQKLLKSVDLGETGMIPLEVRFHHNPDSTHGFVGAALSSTMWHWHKPGDEWEVEKVISVDPVETEGWPFPVPGLITDLLISMDDRWLYFSNWLHGDLRQYDISDPSNPKLTGQVWLGGVIGKTARVGEHQLVGGPQMLQLSLDGKRLYVTNSLYSSWDNQFYPQIAQRGSYMLQIDCDTDNGGMQVNENFYVDFGREPHGPVRAHEVRFPGGDSTSDIWT